MRVRSGPAAGLRMHLPLHRRRSYGAGRHETWVVEALVPLLSKGCVAVDAGAHLGYFSLIMAQAVGKGGRVLSFEPEPGSRALLQRTVSSNDLGQVTVRAEALARQRGEASLLVPGNEAMARRANRQIAELADGGHRPSVHQRRVHQRPAKQPVVQQIDLDAVVLDGVGPQRLDLIKIDVEGDELEVLRGATEVLARCRPAIVLEAHWSQGVPYSPRELVGYLATAGYESRLLARPTQTDSNLDNLLQRIEGCSPPAHMTNFHLLALPQAASA